MATKWLGRSIGIALLVFVCAYIAFNILCVLLMFRRNEDPIPGLLLGIPVGFIAAGISFIFSIVRRNSN
jgi:hypothetical protein